MGRNRQYSSDAERQRAYRQRKAEAEAQQRKRTPVSRKLIKVLGMLGSEHAAERDKAARAATQILKDAGLTWYDVLDTDEPEK
jgi:hypothetical protein